MTSIKTKYGTANIGHDGYYRITSSKEGNWGKQLHRLIFEDFYQIKLPSNVVIHHEDGNKLNNKIWNLVPMTREEHTIIHRKCKKHSDETKEKISEVHTGKTVSEETRKKMSKAHYGRNNSNAKYSLWDITCVHYNKRAMFQCNREPNPCKCFKLKYNGKEVKIGGFHDFVSVEIISDLIKKYMEEED